MHGYFRHPEPQLEGVVDDNLGGHGIQCKREGEERSGWLRKHRANWRKIHAANKDGDSTEEEDGSIDTPVDRDALLFGNESPP